MTWKEAIANFQVQSKQKNEFFRKRMEDLYQKYSACMLVDCDSPDLSIEDAASNRMMEQAMEENLSSFRGTKSKLKSLYEDFIEFVNKTYSVTLSPSLSDVPKDSLDIKIELIKLIHQEMCLDDLEDRLSLSERSVRAYLTEIEKKPLMIQNQRLNPEVTKIVKNRKKYYYTKDRAHPIFLVLQTQSVLELFAALEQYARSDPSAAASVNILAAKIWRQLSDYMKERVENYKDEFGLSEDWYRQIKEDSQRVHSSFQSREEQIEETFRSHIDPPDLRAALKKRSMVQVTVRTDDGNEIRYDGIVMGYKLNKERSDAEVTFALKSGQTIQFSQKECIDIEPL